MPELSVDAHIGRTYGDRYRLDSLVGTGGSARVYESTDTMLRRKVALKVLHPALVGDSMFRRRFRAEAQSAAQVSHPHLVAVHDWGEHETGAYLVTELLRGGSLRDYLDSGRKLSLSQALLVGLHAANGLDAAHSQGLVHRDIKPANLLFGADERLRVGDFGIARAVAEAAWTEPEGALVGTVRYAAPEQGMNGEIDGRTDVYSLALTIIESVTGDVPLVGGSPIATMVMRQDTDVVVPEELGELRSVLTPAGRANRAERPTAEEFAGALKRAAGRLPRPLPLGLGSSNGQTGALIDLDREVIELSDADETVVEHSEQTNTILMESEPKSRRRRWPLVLAILLGVLGLVGYLGYGYYEGEIKTPSHTVENYVGSTLDEAANRLEVNGWRLNVSEIRRDSTEAGQVLEQSPLAGEVLEENQLISLVVSLGEELRSVPVVVGLPLDQAVADIEALGLTVGEVDRSTYDEEIEEGIVLSASLVPGKDVEPGTPLDLSVSAGPAPRLVPDVAGLTTEEVETVVSELGLVLLVEEDFSDEVDEGLAISIAPGPGTELVRGAEVTVVFSKGVAFFEIPDVVGLDAVTAANRLEEAGFVVSDTNGPPNAVVLATDPPAGEFHPKGHSIVIFTRR